MFNSFAVAAVILAVSSSVAASADFNSGNTATASLSSNPSANPSVSQNPSPNSNSNVNQIQNPNQIPNPTQTPSLPTNTAPNAVNPNTGAKPDPCARVVVDPKSRPENQVPTSAQVESGHINYLRYCADCHGKDGEGKAGPKLIGSLMVTGPTYGHIAVALSGHPQTKMPSWGISELSDELIASIITYQRNAWGNNNKKQYGQNAGGVVTPCQVHEYRKTMKNLPVKQDIRT
jgi:mono/diheme cytochrome c family protein